MVAVLYCSSNMTLQESPPVWSIYDIGSDLETQLHYGLLYR